MDIDTLKDMLTQGHDNAILRFGLGHALFKAGESEEAQAIDVYPKGIAVAEKKGDRQAVKEINVFLKRLMK